jgi:hypothetical protein
MLGDTRWFAAALMASQGAAEAAGKMLKGMSLAFGAGRMPVVAS